MSTGRDIHPAATLLPLMSDTQLRDLTDDIRCNGLRNAITLTPTGHILDGRNRYTACHQAGIEPYYVEFSGNPWWFAVATNHDHHDLTSNHRAIIGAQLLDATQHDRWPCPRKQVRELLDVSVASLDRAKHVLRRGVPELITAVTTNVVPLATAVRVTELTPDDQHAYLHRVTTGGNPRRITPPPTQGDDPLSRHEARYRYIQEPTLRTLANSLDGLGVVLTTTGGLDPAITPAEAARWKGDLYRRARSFRQLITLLKERSG